MARKTYPLEFKLDAVALARENGAQMAQVARDLGLAKTTLLNWVRKAGEYITTEIAELFGVARSTVYRAIQPAADTAA